MKTSDLSRLTPIIKKHGLYIKRDDSFEVNGVNGGKARTCWYLSQGANGLVTAGSRESPQVNIVAHIAQELMIPCHIHTPEGFKTPELLLAESVGAKLFQHQAGYNNVIIARAKSDVIRTGYTYIPFGMECEEAVNQTRKQVANVPDNVERIVVSVGSAMSLSGILHGLDDFDKEIEVIGIVVGANPTKRLNEYAPKDWKKRVQLIQSKYDYHDHYPTNNLFEIPLDPVYESKCLPYLKKGDLFWIIGIRQSEKPASGSIFKQQRKTIEW